MVLYSLMSELKTCGSVGVLEAKDAPSINVGSHKRRKAYFWCQFLHSPFDAYLHRLEGNSAVHTEEI